MSLMAGNPFHLEPIIGLFLAKVDIPTLRTLRILNKKFNHMASHELGKRAEKGQLEQIDLSNGDFAEKFNSFLQDICVNPQLFPPSRFIIPEWVQTLESYQEILRTSRSIYTRLELLTAIVEEQNQEEESIFDSILNWFFG